uniref:ATP-dependent RNA helicase n=1 Tax=Dracunculus medinensis TaxID=318479 RepID=A0A158Q3G0_DRAME
LKRLESLKDSQKSKAMRKTRFEKSKPNEQQIIRSTVAMYEEFAKQDSSELLKFDQIPLSSQTLKGLHENNFYKPTEIQRDSLQYSLTGFDIIGAAKTGSGKTLAILIPMLECLWRKSWSRSVDGLGALIIVPTRELAFQIFHILNKVGAHHQLSAGLLIGGTDVEFEKKRLGSVNILVCTPGRLLQHMDENDSFCCDNLQMLIIDEADRILDLGFQSQMNAILENLPKDRQTLLFSATQTKKVADLTRLALRDPIYISVHEKATQATPEKLIQSYFICEDEEKINILWSFLVNHRKKKSLIFVSCCKQARFLTEIFCHLRPGLSLMGLWGTMNQTKRLEVFNRFDHKSTAALIATDVASRGLDFSRIDMVFQLDCPATVDDYIHRVGRTARMDSKGEAFLALTSSQEAAMFRLLSEKNIPVNKIRKLRSTIAQFPNLKEYAQRSFVAYLRSIFLMQNKDVFDVRTINYEALANSYGLVIVPRVRFLAKQSRIQKGITNDTHLGKKKKTAQESLGMLTSSAKINKEDVTEVPLCLSDSKRSKKPLTKVAVAKKLQKRGIQLSRKKVFLDDENEIIEPSKESSNVNTGFLDIDEIRREMSKIDSEDKLIYKEKKKQSRKVTKRNFYFIFQLK